MPATLNDLIKKSKCYGRFYDAAVQECQRCEAWFTCERKMNDAEYRDDLPDAEVEPS